MNARDQAVANEVGTPQALMCAAAGCPNLWTVDAGKGRLCTAHAWSAHREWPAITRQQQDVETDRARSLAEPRMPAATMSPDEKIALLQRLRTVISEPKDPRAWAHRLKARELAGETLNDRQKTAWRVALASATTPEDA